MIFPNYLDQAAWEKAKEIAESEIAKDGRRDIVGWPEGAPQQCNGHLNVVCDMWSGPCACGAWHTEGR